VALKKIIEAGVLADKQIKYKNHIAKKEAKQQEKLEIVKACVKDYHM